MYSAGLNRYYDFIKQLDSFDIKVNNSFNENIETRRKKLKEAENIIGIKEINQKIFLRNPDVVAERLYLANGICDKCKQKAPFIRKSNGMPYLEVHHIIPLSEGGWDIIENTQALCPNCHRKAHFG